MFLCAHDRLSNPIDKMKNAIRVEPFGTLPDGRQVNRYTLSNGKGMEVKVINFGGIIQSLCVPNKEGVIEDVTLGFDTLAPYLQNAPYFGAIIGRFGNRIAKGKFTLEGVEYTLPVNNAPNHLHGGTTGFDKVFWEIAVEQDSNTLVLTYVSRDGEEGYPGTLHCSVVYRLTENNELWIEYTATTDKATLINLTQHAYFNLAGSKSTSVLDHVLTLEAEAFLPISEHLIPIGEYRNVKHTVFDFLQPKPIGKHIAEKDEQLLVARGYDHCWVVNKVEEDLLQKVGRVEEPHSGRRMEVYSSEPGVQFYTGNFLDGSLKGKNCNTYPQRSGFCLETQHFPDSPNQVTFPNTVLHPHDTYRSTTVYAFSVAN